MAGWSGLDRLLATDPRDAGCASTRQALPGYAEFVTEDGRAQARYPAVAAHLAACPPCAEDLEGLLALLRDGA